MNLLLGVCLALGIGLLAGTVFRNRHRLLILGLITCGGVVLTSATIAYHATSRSLFWTSNSLQRDPIWSSPDCAPMLFCLGVMISVVGYQIGQRMIQPNHNKIQLSKFAILIRYLPSVYSLLLVGLLINQNRRFQLQFTTQGQLGQIASITFGNVQNTFRSLNYVPVSVQRLLPRSPDAVAMHFRQGIKHPGRHIRENGFTHLGIVGFQDSEIDVQDILALRENTQLSHLSFEKCRFTEGALPLLSSFPSMVVLTIKACTFSPKDKCDFSGMPLLNTLDLSGSSISDDCLSGLSNNPIPTFILRDTPISDAGMPHILNIPRLRMLDLSGTHVTGAGLLGTKTPLRVLDLDGTQVDDAAMVAISNLSSLEYVGIASTKVTTSGIAKLVKLPLLWGLNIDKCDVGDEVRVHLSAMARLQRWSARNTRMTSPDFHDY